MATATRMMSRKRRAPDLRRRAGAAGPSAGGLDDKAGGRLGWVPVLKRRRFRRVPETEETPGVCDEAAEVAGLTGRNVVLDTRSMLLYVGRLKRWGEAFVELADCDVHDTAEGRSTKEVYMMEAARNGVQQNRRRVLVRKAEVISVSALDDVIVY